MQFIMNKSTLCNHDKMIVSKYLNEYYFKMFVNNFKLNNLYFTSYNYININLSQNYTICNLKSKIDKATYLLPNLKEIIININIDSNRWTHDEYINKIYDLILKIKSIINSKYKLKIQFNRSNILISQTHGYTFNDINNNMNKYILLMELANTTKFYLILYHLENIVKMYDKLNYLTNLKFVFYGYIWVGFNESEIINNAINSKLNNNILYLFNYLGDSKLHLYKVSELNNFNIKFDGFKMYRFCKNHDNNENEKDISINDTYLNKVRLSKLIYTIIKFKNSNQRLINFSDDDISLNNQINNFNITHTDDGFIIRKLYYNIMCYKYGVKNIYSGMVDSNILINKIDEINYKINLKTAISFSKLHKLEISYYTWSILMDDIENINH